MADVRPHDFHAFLYAFALGCLDKGDFIDLMEYIDGGGAFSWQELGEYQNLCALLPSFLNIEDAPADIKDKVARRLYRYRDEKKSAAPPPIPATASPFSRTRTSVGEKAKKTSRIEVINPPPTSTQEKDDNIIVPEEVLDTFSPRRKVEGGRPSQGTQASGRVNQTIPDRIQYTAEQENPIPEKPEDVPLYTPQTEPEDVPLYTPPAEPDMSEFIINQDGLEAENLINTAYDGALHLNVPDEPAAIPAEPEPMSAQEIEQKKKTESDLEAIRKKVVENVAKEDVAPVRKAESDGISPRTFFAFIALLIAVIAAMYILFNAKISKIDSASNSKITEVVSKLSKSNEIQHEVDRLLASNDRTLVSLKGVSVSDAYGFVVFEQKSGFIQLGKLPQSSPQAGYQLWIQIDEKVIPVSSPFEFGFDNKTVEYFRIADIPGSTAKQTVKFFVTQEKTGTSPTAPSHTVFLAGSL